MKFILILVALTASLISKAQADIRNCADLRIGVTHFAINSSNFYDKENTGAGGNTSYSIYSINQNASNPNVLYVDLGYAAKFNRMFELAAGFSFEHTSIALDYRNVSEKPSGSENDHFERTVTDARGDLNSNIYSLSLAPVLRIVNTKFIFGISNLKYIDASAKNMNGTTNVYDVVYKQSSGFEPTDSIVTYIGTTEGARSDKEFDRVQFGLSLGLEQEIPISKYRFLTGVKASAIPGATMPFATTVYIGMRFSKDRPNLKTEIME